MKELLSYFLIAIVGITGCSQVVDKGESESPKTLPRELTANEKQLAEANHSFSYALFRKTVSQQDSENIFISPLSVSMALGMTLNGAAGETKAGMKEALGLQDMDLPAMNESYASFIELLGSADSKVNMKLANSIWYKQGFSVQESFRDTVKKFFDARIDSLDFSDPSAGDTINQWVSDNTEGLIEELIQGSIPPNMVMYLINAIYFEGDWNYQFDPDNTSEQEFATGAGTVPTDMMSQKNNLAAYVSNEVKVLDLAYGDSLFSMTLMMPASEDSSIDKFVQEKMTAENLEYWRSRLTRDTTNISLPKFELEYEIKMNDVLKSMGMEQAFDEDAADFSNISSDRRLFISEVKHKSFVEVNEEGTEAAAVTSVGVGITSAGPKVRTINFDRPFIFMIRERTSGTILFMGKMQDPTQ